MIGSRIQARPYAMRGRKELPSQVISSLDQFPIVVHRLTIPMYIDRARS